MTATNIVASKYLHGTIDTAERETGVRQLVSRVAETVRDWGMQGDYFATPEDAQIFHDELAHMLVRRRRRLIRRSGSTWAATGWSRFRCPELALEPANRRGRVFASTGYTIRSARPASSMLVNDSLDSILTLAKTEGMLFKWGTGTGTNLSAIRGSTEELVRRRNGSPARLSFMRGFDAFAGVIKSGGKTRRAAKMVILNVDHPDIMDFIECKSKEEAKAWALMREGYDGSRPDSEAYSSIFFQNANNSVRVTDEFMRAYERDGEFSTKTVKDGKAVKTYKARDVMKKIAEATWQCGDPGMQYDTTINKWHTSKNTGRINASNPCSEYMFLDNSACNLASFNLMKFLKSQRRV